MPAREPMLQNVAPPDEIATVLIISRDDEDHTLLRRALPHPNWRILDAYGLAEGVALLLGTPVAVVVSECRLDEGSWRDVLDEISRLPHSPLPRLVVASGLADEGLWAEVLNRGGYDLLVKPLREGEVSWVVSCAWLEWRRERDSTVAAQGT